MGNASSEKFAQLSEELAAMASRISALEQQVAALRGLIEPAGGSDDADPIDLSIDAAEDIAPAAVPVVEDFPAVPVAEGVPVVPGGEGDSVAPVVEDMPFEPVVEGVPVVPVVEDIPAAPIVEDIPVAPVVEDIPAAPVVEAPVVEDIPAPAAADAEDPFSDLFGSRETPAEKPKKAARKSINDSAAVQRKAVIDTMADQSAWLHDIPGPEVKSLRSAIGLGDQVVYIRRLFRDDSALYQSTIDRLGAMNTLKEAVAYLAETFPEWNPASDDVYRFMMAVRRKIRK